jgi:tripartite-type tricarboxylate transporter receptor subunit TctC
MPRSHLFPRRLLARLALLACLAPALAWAQTFPSRPVRLIIPFAAGGATDAAARAIAQALEATLGQSVVVENRPGAAGAIAAEAVVKSAPDGHTLCFCSTGAIVILPRVTPNLSYRPLKDLTAVTHVLNYENVLLARPTLKASTLADLIRLARNSSQPLTYATPGAGSTNHLAAEWLQMETGIKLLHVPYKGESLGMTDLISGQVDLMLGSPMLSTPFIKDGKVKAIVMLDHTRSKALLPEVPTVAESGYPKFAMSNFVGIHAPAGTPPAVVNKLAQAFTAALNTPALMAKLRSMGLEPRGGTPAEYENFLAGEGKIWDPVLARVSLKRD